MMLIFHLLISSPQPFIIDPFVIIFADMRKALSRDVEKLSVRPLPHPVRPEDLEWPWTRTMENACQNSPWTSSKMSKHHIMCSSKSNITAHNVHKMSHRVLSFKHLKFFLIWRTTIRVWFMRGGISRCEEDIKYVINIWSMFYVLWPVFSMVRWKQICFVWMWFLRMIVIKMCANLQCCHVFCLVYSNFQR